jgi:hypothetical protein
MASSFENMQVIIIITKVGDRVILFFIQSNQNSLALKERSDEHNSYQEKHRKYAA